MKEAKLLREKKDKQRLHGKDKYGKTGKKDEIQVHEWHDYWMTGEVSEAETAQQDEESIDFRMPF